jgi:hypothetical protein
VYIYFCQENQAPTHVDNLDFILSAMEAIGRTHSITRSFLRQALLDIECNGILDIVRIPSAERLIRKLMDNAVPHNVPLLARTRLSRHSEAQPPLPGLLSGRSSSYNTPYRYDTWRQPSRTYQTAASSTLGSSSSSADGHMHKRKRTTTPSTNSSPRNDSDVPIQPSISFSYLPIRSDTHTTTSSYSTTTINTAASANQVISTDTTNINSGSGTAEGAIIDIIGNNPFQFLDPRNVNVDWDAINADLGIGTSTSTRHACGGGDRGDSRGEMNRFADTGGG